MDTLDDATRVIERLPNLAVLYADISDSTRLYEEHGDAVARSDVARCVELMSEVAGRYDGRVVKTIGDEILCLFPGPANAALAANEMQNSVSQSSSDGLFQTGLLRIKIGMHFGPGEEQESDIHGEASALAQQIINLAKADQILTSREFVDALPAELRVGSRHLDRVPADGRSGVLEVVELIWEVSGLTQESNTRTPQPRVQHTRLVLTAGDTSITLGKERPGAMLGRVEGNDLVVPTDLTSRQHAQIEFRRNRFHITDNSANGTLVRTDEGKTDRLRRENLTLDGSGIICLGGTPEDNPGGVLHYRCE